VPAEQRIFSLVLALVASPQGLLKREILSVVYGYSDRLNAGVNEAALERQFERDKDQIRDLGIPIEAIDSPLEPGNNQLTRYRIRKELMEMPAGVRFSAHEIAMLRIAARAWAEGSLTSEAHRILMKVEALGAGLDPQYIGIEARIGIIETAAPALHRAIEDRTIVTFEYQHPDYPDPLLRHVAPLSLHREDGRWHLIAHDLDRGVDRVFLLSRIVSPVRSVAGEKGKQHPAIVASAGERIAAALHELTSVGARQSLRVVAAPGSRAEARLAERSQVRESHGDQTALSLTTLDYHEMTRELASYGEEVVVLEPSPLRDAVVDALRLAREQHSNPRNANSEGE